MAPKARGTGRGRGRGRGRGSGSGGGGLKKRPASAAVAGKDSGSSSSSSNGSEDREQSECLSLLDIGDILAPLPLEDFVRDVWGLKPYSTRVSDRTLEQLRSGFWKGDSAEVLADCRKEDNSRFSGDEVSNMQNDLDAGKTLNLPFCFCPAARELKSSFIECCGGLGNDVEVGVYFSRAGGDIAHWHFDNNHNITIQLRGHKDWHHIAGSPATLGGRGMHDFANNRFEQQLTVPPTGCMDTTIYNLQPGSVIYLPPGHWHQVVTVEGDSFSVDLRVANVLQARWICEAIFAGLLEGGASGTLASLSPSDFVNGLSSQVSDQLRSIGQNIEAFVLRTRIPRCMPFEFEHSDGLHSGATLSFLEERAFVSSLIPASAMLRVNGLVSMTLKRRDDQIMVLQLSSTSSLSTMEYLRFSLLCNICLYEAVDVLRRRGVVCLSDLHAMCQHRDLTLLVRVLVHANVLHQEEYASTHEQSADVDGGRRAPVPSADRPAKVARKVLRRPAAAMI